MRKINIGLLFIYIVGIFFIGCTRVIYAQSSSSYKLGGYEIGGGGETSADSSSFSLEAILGQSADNQSSTNYKANSGLLNVQMANVPSAPTFVNTSSWYNKLKLTVNPTVGTMGTITHDASTNGGSIISGSSSNTFSHTIGSGVNRLLVVSVGVEDSPAPSSISVTYNGTALTQATSISTVEATIQSVYIFYALEQDLPSAGTYDVIVTLGSNLSIGQMIAAATSVEGVAQTTPEATQTSQTGVDGTTYSTNITTVTDNAWVFDAVGGGNITTWTPDGGQTERSDQSAAGFGSALATSTKLVASAGSTTLGWTASGTQNRFAHALAAWAPASIADPGDTTYAIAISTDAFSSDTKYVQSDHTIGSALGTEDFQTYPAWGASSGFYVIGLIPSTTYTVKVKAARGDFTESGYGPTSSVATSALQISFDIDIGGAGDPGETASPYNISMGSLTAGSVTTATDRIWVDLVTNSEAGGMVYVYDVNAGLKSTRLNETITSATADLGSGAVLTGFGLQGGSKTQTSGGPLDYTSPYNGASHNVGLVDTNVREIFNTTNLPLVGGRGSILLKAKSSSVTSASTDYADTLTLVATASF